MIKVINEKDCCGCSACSVVCPQRCISMKEGTLGSLFPVVDEKKCVECGKCNSVCPVLNKFETKRTENSAYAAYANEENIRKRGSSGGMIEVFSRYLIQKKYTVYGAAFDENLKLKCTKAEEIEQLFPLLKSKYLQSDLSEKYLEIESKLKNGEGILFVSTPCQVLSLKLFLKKEYEKLITIDFFCHGVGSQKFFDECRAYDEKKHNIKIKKFVFREKKKNGSTPHYFSINDGKAKIYYNSVFYMAFQKYICLRESCYDCIFSGKTRYSDITVGDFHEIDKYVDKINRFDGVSTVIVNTEKGKKLFEEIKDNLTTYEIGLQRLIDDGVCFCGGTKKPPKRNEFIKSYNEDDFDNFVNKHLNKKEYRIQDIYYRLPLFLRKILKKVMGI